MNRGLGRSLAAFLVVLCFGLDFHAPVLAQTSAPSKQPAKERSGAKNEPLARQISEEERQLISAVVNVANPAAKLQALAVFLEKFPASVMRWRVVLIVGTVISREPDPAQKVSHAEKFLGLASPGRERDFAAGVLADAYLKTGRTEEGFGTAALIGDEAELKLDLLLQLASAGAAEARKQNPKFLEPARRYAALAVRAFEADQRPADMLKLAWDDYKVKTMPATYQTLGLLEWHSGAIEEAKANLRKATDLAPADPAILMTLGTVLNDEYTAAAKQYAGMSSGPEREVLLEKTLALLDEVIDTYVRLVALTDRTPQREFVRARVWTELETYYKYRHNGRLDGLQALIDQYKKQ